MLMPKSKFLTFFPQPSFPVVVPPTHYQSQKPRVIFDSSLSPPIHQVLLLPPPKSGHFISPQLVFHSSPPAPSFPATPLTAQLVSLPPFLTYSHQFFRAYGTNILTFPGSWALPLPLPSTRFIQFFVASLISS